MLKCVVIHGSPRRGNTWDVLNRVILEMDKCGEFEWDIIELRKENIPTCLGCFNCILKGEDKCPHKSYMYEICEKMEKADIFIITTPVYSMSVSGLLKNFIDHMSFKFHRPNYFKKKALVITTTAGAGHKSTAKYIRSVLEYWCLNKIEILPIAYRGIELNEKNIKMINKKGREFAKDINRNKLKSASVKSVFMYNAWRAMAKNSSQESADYIFWNKLDEKHIYADEIKVNLLGKLSGKFARKIMNNKGLKD